MSPKHREKIIFTLLIATVSVLAATAWSTNMATGLEAISFITGAICVWLTVKESIWNFPIGLANVATFAVVFYQSKLFADAGLQVIYSILILIGWYLWLRGGALKTALEVSSSARHESIILFISAMIFTLGLWHILHLAGGSASFVDALTTSISLGAQWLLNRKRLENWIWWIVVDIIYIPLYIYKQLYLTALLYMVFLAMACWGLKEWRRVFTQDHAENKSHKWALS